MACAIRVEDLSKRYRVQPVGERADYRTLRDELGWLASAPLRWLRGGAANGIADEFWALREVAFEVKPGELVGVIGRNGAGKSTLLKILSRITRPTSGEVLLRGRVGSLLEVGTGFHPELTGRENIYLNGAILGMTRKEIQRKFDEIVAFAEIERFLDTPVKRYSSGMYVRLAFAVAAHLDSEILLADEVLAVGDIAFQKKCLGKMNDVARLGRTVVFVSHDMRSVNRLCRRVLLLEQGRVVADGSVREVTAGYEAQMRRPTATGGGWADLGRASHQGSGKARFTSVCLRPLGPSGESLAAVVSGCDLEVEAVMHCEEDVPQCNVALVVFDGNENRLIDASLLQAGRPLDLEAGRSVVARFVLRDLLLRPGIYLLQLWAGVHGVEEVDSIEYAASFEVLERDGDSTMLRMFPSPYLCRFDAEVHESTVPGLRNGQAGPRPSELGV